MEARSKLRQQAKALLPDEVELVSTRCDGVLFVTFVYLVLLQ